MSEVLPSLKAAWTRLPQKSPGAGQLRVVALDAVRAGISACLSTDGLHGLVVSLTPAERALIPQELDAASGSTLAASLTYFTDSAGEEGRFLHVWCRDHTVDDAFDSFCVLLCQKLENQTVTKALSASTAEFRKLLAESESPDSNVIGVIGELIFLRQLLRKDPGAIRAWAGPQGGRHDFRRGRNAVEVKTSLRSDVQGLTVTISAFDQLDVPADGRLILQVYQLEQVDNGDHSIATLSEDIRSNLEGDDDSLFVGWLAKKHPRFSESKVRFSVLQSRTFEVGPDFPSLVSSRLKKGKLDTGVSGVTYKLSLEAASAFRADEQLAILALLETTET